MATLRELLDLPALPEGVESDGGALKKALAQLKGVQESHAALSAKLSETLGFIPEVTAESLSIISAKLAEAEKSRSPSSIVETVERAQAALKSILNRAMSAPRPDAPPLPEELATKSVQAAQEFCASKARILDALRKDAQSRLGGTIPAPLEAAIALAETALNSARTGTELETLEAAAETGEQATDAVIDQIEALAEAHTKATEQLAELETEVALLDAHTSKAALDAELARLQGEVVKAKAHLVGHEYDEVETICSTETPKAKAATKLADGAARYDYVKPAREKRMLEFAAITHVFVVAERQKIQDILDAAFVDGTAKKFDDALEKLDKMPPLCDKLELLDEAQKSFASQDAAWGVGYTELMPYFPRADTQAAYATEIAAYKALLDGARADGAADRFTEGVKKLNKLWGDLSAIEDQVLTHHGEYVDELAIVKPKVEAFRTQPADFDIAAIETEVGVLEKKLQDAETMARAKTFDTAKVVLDEIKAREPAVFEIGKRSGAAKKAAKDCKEELDKLRGLAAVTGNLAVADAMLTAAEGYVTGRKFDPADEAIANAKAIMEVIRAAKSALEATAETTEEIAAKKAAENAAHEATYQQLKSVVEAHKAHMNSANEDSVLNADIATITGNLATADTAATATPPNYATALTTLQSADALGAKADDKMAAHKAHKALNGKKAFLEGKDTHNGCATEITAWDGTKTIAWAEFAAGNYVKCLAEIEKVTRAADRLEAAVQGYSENVDYYNAVIQPNEKTGLPSPSFNFDAATLAAHSAQTTEADRQLAEVGRLMGIKSIYPA